MTPLVEAFLYIYNFDCTPDAISQALHVPPTKTWLAGERIGKSLRSYDSNGWSLKSQLEADSEPERHLQWLMDQVPKGLSEMSRVANHWSAQLSLVIKMEDETPPLNLKPETIKRMSSLGLGLDVDLFIQEK